MKLLHLKKGYYFFLHRRTILKNSQHVTYLKIREYKVAWSSSFCWVAHKMKYCYYCSKRCYRRSGCTFTHHIYIDTSVWRWHQSVQKKCQFLNGHVKVFEIFSILCGFFPPFASVTKSSWTHRCWQNMCYPFCLRVSEILFAKQIMNITVIESVLPWCELICLHVYLFGQCQ